jgi:tetratricopeptide (TPR) repeat protein
MQACHSGLGYLLYVADRYDEAQATLEKALDLNPRAAFVYLTLGKIRIAEGKPQRALAEIEKEPLESGKLAGQSLAYHALGRDTPNFSGKCACRNRAVVAGTLAFPSKSTVNSHL